MLKRNTLLTWLLAGLAAALAPALAHACAVCLTGDGDPTADAFNWSVLFLMATPYTVVGSIAGWLFYTYRRAAAKRSQGQATESPLHLAWSEKESGR
ncbi:MAG: hypothetical protein HYU31_07220 [Deltaproteobacteria bacterium]|nr:hypothetical protein [Deltaproteobacteria bacterium]MBI2230954.1 hypothetical protein [Deltaproteobacteria bacterium]MBI2367301.1 hypothetical protein [Deltaproteobacteria bacterium]MBI2532514.1 hypothetical protein [Deltaproteobacteria bacterium]MBI3063380.1 hypothetical protein [Deltaproteobacteria bacterium]